MKISDNQFKIASIRQNISLAVRDPFSLIRHCRNNPISWLMMMMYTVQVHGPRASEVRTDLLFRGAGDASVIMMRIILLLHSWVGWSWPVNTSASPPPSPPPWPGSYQDFWRINKHDHRHPSPLTPTITSTVDCHHPHLTQDTPQSFLWLIVRKKN